MTKTMLIVLIAAVVFIVFCVLTIFALLKNHKVLSSFEDKMEESDKTLKRAIGDMLAMQEKMQAQEARIKKLEEMVQALGKHAAKAAKAAQAPQTSKAPQTVKAPEPQPQQTRVVNTPRTEQPPAREEQRQKVQKQEYEEEIYLDDLFEEVPPVQAEDSSDDIERKARELRSMLNEYRKTPQAQAAPQPQPQRPAQTAQVQQSQRPAPRPAQAAPQSQYQQPAATGYSGTGVGKSGKEYTLSDLESLIRE